jgi:hypothetical protein
MAQALRGSTTSTTQVDELLLIKELAVAKDFKFSLDPAKHQLTSIKHLQAWFTGILVMLERFPHIQVFLFMTVASINNQQNLKLRVTAVKSEKGVKTENQVDDSALRKAILAEVSAYPYNIDTFAEADEFLASSHYGIQIRASQDLLYLMAPTLFHAPAVTSSRILTVTEQFKSPEYQETVTLGDNFAGQTLVSTRRVFVFPSEQRINTAKTATFYYVKTAQPESRIHQLLRPLLWRWLKVALGTTDFAHLLKAGWEHDHSWIFQELIEQANREREETDQVFAIFNCQKMLFAKVEKDSLYTWYLQALEDIEQVNAITRTFKQDSDLMIIPVGFVNSMYKVHAHRSGFSEIMSRVSRENDGYMPIQELQRQIAMEISDKNRKSGMAEFETQNNELLKPKANVAGSTRTKSEVNSTTDSTPLKTPIETCFNFLEGKCLTTPCPQGRPHQKLKVPSAACSKWLTDKSSCDGSCNLLHERWAVLVKKINSGEISPVKAKKPRKEVPAVSTAPATPPVAQATRGGRGGRGRGGLPASNPAPDPSVPATNAQQTQQTSGMPAGNVVIACSRCGKSGHVFAGCYANFHFDGTQLESPKPAQVPEHVAIDRKARWLKQKTEAAQKDPAHVYSAEFMTELEEYRESMERSIGRNRVSSCEHTNEINTLEGFEVVTSPL